MARLLLCGVVAFAASASALAQRILSPEEAKPILDSFYSTLHDANTLHIVETMSVEPIDFRIEHWLMKPSSYRSVLKSSGGKSKPTEMRTYMDANDAYSLDMKAKTLTILRRSPGSPFIVGLESFVQKDRPKYTQVGRVTETEFHKKLVYSIEVGPQQAPGSFASVVIDRASFLPVAWTYTWHNATRTAEYDVKVNEPMQAKDFSTMLPKGFRLVGDLRNQPAH